MDVVECSNASLGDHEYYLAIDFHFITVVKVLVTVCSSFSFAGASWIIVTFFAFKDLRTTARSLLVNLSIADILIAVSHFVGILANYERFMPYYNGTSKQDSVYDPLCVSQAAVTIFGTLSMFLWTMSIAVYILALTMFGRRKRLLRIMVGLMYVICWGVPSIAVILSAVQRVLGSYTGAPGCFIVDKTNTTSQTATIVFIILSYEIWVYIAYVFLPLVYLLVFCYLRCKKVKAEAINVKIMAVSSKTDIKLLLVPILFLLLRVWTTVDDIFVFYVDTYHTAHYHCSKAKVAMLSLMAIGINSQGTVNAILFCLLTKSVRQRWYYTMHRLYRRCHWRRTSMEEESFLEETLSLSTNSDTNRKEHYNTITNDSVIND